MLYITQGNYGSGWEDVDTNEDKQEAKRSLREYDDNELYPHRLVVRRS